jgi:nitroreductase
MAVAGVSGLTARAVGQAVLAPGQSDAYAAWSDWQGTAGEGLLRLVRSAVLAANGHNTQPWRFVLARDRIDMFADAARGEGALDPLDRELLISLGCALENLTLAGRADGLGAEVALVPEPANPTHVVRVGLSSGARARRTDLYQAIPHRHINRYPYANRRLRAGALDGFGRLVDEGDLTIVWLTSSADRAAFGDLTVAATRASIADRAASAVDHAWFRHSQAAIDQHKDGLTIDGAGLPDATVAAAKLLPGISPADQDSGFRTATRDRQVPTAAAFGVICALVPTGPAQQLAAGRLYQRIHLHATTQELALQPMNQAVERADHERASGAEPTFGDALAGLLPAELTPLMPFRIGYPTHDGKRSPRRHAEEVTRHA